MRKTAPWPCAWGIFDWPVFQVWLLICPISMVYFVDSVFCPSCASGDCFCPDRMA
jgi:hypothetical protein